MIAPWLLFIVMLIIVAGVVVASYYLFPELFMPSWHVDLARKREQAEIVGTRTRECVIECMDTDTIIKKQAEADAVKGGDPRGAYRKVLPAIDGVICPTGMRIRHFTNGVFCFDLGDRDRVIVDRDYNFIGVSQHGEHRDEENYDYVTIDDEEMLVPRG